MKTTLNAISAGLDKIKSRPDLQYLFIIALVLRLCYMMLMMGQISSQELMNLAPDSIRYINIARGFLDFNIADEGALLIFGPGYGAFLTVPFFIFGIGPISVIVIQILLSGISCLLIYKLGKMLTGSRSV